MQKIYWVFPLFMVAILVFFYIFSVNSKNEIKVSSENILRFSQNGVEQIYIKKEVLPKEIVLTEKVKMMGNDYVLLDSIGKYNLIRKEDALFIRFY